MYTDAMAVAARRQSDAEIIYPRVQEEKIKARCEHGNIINIHYLHQ